MFEYVKPPLPGLEKTITVRLKIILTYINRMNSGLNPKLNILKIFINYQIDFKKMKKIYI